MSNRVFASLAALLLAAKAINASFDFCIGLKGPTSFGREVVGFKLWNDQGEEADQYRSIYSARKTRMQNNNWCLDMKFYTPNFIELTSVFVSSDSYGIIGEVPFKYICDYQFNIYYYGCYGADGYCEKHQEEHKNFCKTKLQM
ncbi:hypothetical protein BGX26_004517, partial [Mortierella sp. AD094]